MKSIFSLLLVFSALRNCFAQADQSQQLRGPSSLTDKLDVEQRQLGNQNNNNRYRQWMQYYQNNNNYYGRRGGYYGRYYSKANNQQNYYEEGDDTEEYYEDDATTATTDDGSSSFIPSEIEEQFWAWYESPPSQWSAVQWTWFFVILVSTVGLMFCCCLGCANLCMEGQDRACKSSKENFDDYTSIDSAKRGSFASVSTAGGTIADDATCDNIMLNRSA